MISVLLLYELYMWRELKNNDQFQCTYTSFLLKTSRYTLRLVHINGKKTHLFLFYTLRNNTHQTYNFHMRSSGYHCKMYVVNFCRSCPTWIYSTFCRDAMILKESKWNWILTCSYYLEILFNKTIIMQPNFI